MFLKRTFAFFASFFKKDGNVKDMDFAVSFDDNLRGRVAFEARVDGILFIEKLKKELLCWKVAVIIGLLVALVFFGKLNGNYSASWKTDGGSKGSPFGGMSSKISGRAHHSSYIARVKVSGIILSDEHRGKVLSKIALDDEIKGVLLVIDSPGGSLGASEVLYNQIRKISQKKPVAAIIEDLGASGGYMAAVGADFIVAHKSSMVGSIGVIMQSFEVTEMAKKLGISLTTFKTNELKGVPSPLEKITENAGDSIKEMLRQSYDIFVQMVSSRRKIDGQNLSAVANGRVFLGEKALEHKLIDAVGDEEVAVKWILDKKKLPEATEVKEVSLKESRGLLKDLTASIFPNFFSTKIVPSSGLMTIWSGY